MNIILTQKIIPFVIPVVPLDVRVGFPQNNESFSTLEGELNIIGKKGLREVSWSSFFPVNKNYSFEKKGSLPYGWLYVAFLENNQEKPIRCIITSKTKVAMLNMKCTIENFDYQINKSGDIDYNLSLREYIETEEKKTKLTLDGVKQGLIGLAKKAVWYE